jgi:hypothetical protein
MEQQLTVYWLSSRLLDDKNYAKRHGNFLKVVKALDSNYWHETTSFIVFESSHSITAIARALKKVIDPKVDHFLIRMMESKSARICGPIPNRRIFDLLLDEKAQTYLQVV